MRQPLGQPHRHGTRNTGTDTTDHWPVQKFLPRSRHGFGFFFSLSLSVFSNTKKPNHSKRDSLRLRRCRRRRRWSWRRGIPFINFTFLLLLHLHAFLGVLVRVRVGYFHPTFGQRPLATPLTLMAVDEEEGWTLDARQNATNAHSNKTKQQTQH